jgi:hypothetical protein
MLAHHLTYRGVQLTLVHEARGWTAYVPGFGKTLYFPSWDDAVDEAERLIDAFSRRRLLRRAG